jgi:hypothetical protein
MERCLIGLIGCNILKSRMRAVFVRTFSERDAKLAAG